MPRSSGCRSASASRCSEVACLALLGLEGNHRLLRHALAQPVTALRLATGLLAAQHPDDVDAHAQIAECFRRIEAVLAPPVVKSTTL